MKSAVCTLFENSYHFGLAALSNSLHRFGFKGSIYAGYKGAIPYWASQAEENASLMWPGARSFQIADGPVIHFLPVGPGYHLANYKPNFMLQLWDGPAKDEEAIAYFDPDIVLKCEWVFFEKWMDHGVALVHEITANDMPPSHPIRKEWEKVIIKSGRISKRALHSYINSGFCGVSKSNIEFLHVWKDIFDIGMLHFNLQSAEYLHVHDRTNIFFARDQDALNIAAMCCIPPLSEIGPEGMDFISGGWVMSHAIGAPKPWQKNFILSALKGVNPTNADKAFWQHVSGSIQPYSLSKMRIKRISIRVASFVSRFYTRK